jgi:hypothetical protein|tara:strand:- start:848 stop:1090 length:243 start_codon:yes stop_codon:yes gene_type:complete
VGDEITTDQAASWVDRLIIDVGGATEKGGVKGVGGYVQYTQPIIDKKLDITIGAAGHYVDWGSGNHKGIDYKGIDLTYKF